MDSRVRTIVEVPAYFDLPGRYFSRLERRPVIQNVKAIFSKATGNDPELAEVRFQILVPETPMDLWLNPVREYLDFRLREKAFFSNETFFLEVRIPIALVAGERRLLTLERAILDVMQRLLVIDARNLRNIGVSSYQTQEFHSSDGMTNVAQQLWRKLTVQ